MFGTDVEICTWICVHRASKTRDHSIGSPESPPAYFVDSRSLALILVFAQTSEYWSSIRETSSSSDPVMNFLYR